MASKRRQRRRECRDKKRFPTMDAALEAMKYIRFRRQGLRAYQCKFCEGWHFGHPNQIQLKELRREELGL